MTEPMAVFMLLSTLCVTVSTAFPQSACPTVVHPGDNVSVFCEASDEERVIYMYKQPLGRLMQTVAVGVYSKVTPNGAFNDSRFNVSRKKTQVVLTITNVNKEDEAAYFCKVGSFFHAVRFVKGTFLAVEDERNQHKFIIMEQTAAAASVQPTLQCSLPSPGEHTGHWFRARSQQYQPGIIYTHRSRSEEGDQRKCIYRLSESTQDWSVSGTFYCAVAACAQVLFGGGTKENTDIKPTAASRPISSAVVNVGGNVTFGCPVPATETYFYWHKQPLGGTIQTVTDGFYGKRVDEKFNHSRFLFTRNNIEHIFTIVNLTKEDEALYFCQSGSSYGQDFINSKFVTVIDETKEQKFVSVEQTPASVSAQPGAVVSLQCSLVFEDEEKPVQCPGEHSVYWFRAGSAEYKLGMILIHKNKTEDDRKCIYRLSKTIHDWSESGTYYCAVTTNTQILFGEGTKVEMSVIGLDMVHVLGMMSACCAVMITVLILYPKNSCEQPNGEFSSACYYGHDQSKKQDGELKAVNYAALELHTTTELWDVKQREQACVYSVAVYYTQQELSLNTHV